MPRLRIHTTSPLEDKIRRLEDELCAARWVIIHLMRPDLEKLLRAQVGCKTFDEVHEWKSRAVDGILDFAARAEQPTEVDQFGRPRVLCPLCGQGPQSTYDKGFLPEGLRRHLSGTYNAHQCSVFRAAEQLARESAREAKSRE
ncbi:hypothetical protein [Cupriavidus necator]|uniref:hypothetical protein n=1 Tax=Cupriavidus necator TaxID=106590 RepID=UPI00129E28EC|nr:hypothetical protein [Cupriavidus necator]